MPRVPRSTPCFPASCVHPWSHPMNRKHLSVPAGLTWSLPPGGPCVTVALTGPILGPGEASLSLEAGSPREWYSLLILLQRPDLCPRTLVGLVNLPAGDGERGPPTAKSFTHSSHRHSWSLCSASLGVAVAGTGFHSSDKGPGLYGREWLCMCLPQFQVVEKCYLGRPRLRGQEGMPGYALLATRPRASIPLTTVTSPQGPCMPTLEGTSADLMRCGSRYDGHLSVPPVGQLAPCPAASVDKALLGLDPISAQARRPGMLGN